MTDAQFDALADLLRMTSQSILCAARLVLVNGERMADAARETGCLPNNLARAVTRLQDADERMRAAYGHPSPST